MIDKMIDTVLWGLKQIKGLAVSLIFAIASVVFVIDVLSGGAVQLWDSPEKRIYQACVQKERISIGITIRENDAKGMAIKAGNRFNLLVKDELENYEKGITARIHPNFSEQLDIYYAKVNGKDEIVVLPRGSETPTDGIYEKLKLEY